ncbi:hypothetical protein J6590_089183 [Homalodisca vitripennis]|nr:hypothetical protein J6590_089183 [Homalodisca vitripennis]
MNTQYIDYYSDYEKALSSTVDTSIYPLDIHDYATKHPYTCSLSCHNGNKKSVLSCISYSRPRELLGLASILFQTAGTSQSSPPSSIPDRGNYSAPPPCFSRRRELVSPLLHLLFQTAGTTRPRLHAFPTAGTTELLRISSILHQTAGTSQSLSSIYYSDRRNYSGPASMPLFQTADPTTHPTELVRPLLHLYSRPRELLGPASILFRRRELVSPLLHLYSSRRNYSAPHPSFQTAGTSPSSPPSLSRPRTTRPLHLTTHTPPPTTSAHTHTTIYLLNNYFKMFNFQLKCN